MVRVALSAYTVSLVRLTCSVEVVFEDIYAGAVFLIHSLISFYHFFFVYFHNYGALIG